MTNTSKAAVLFELDRPLKIVDLIIPNLKPGQVLVDIEYSGVCHTQLNEVRGLKGEDRFLPHTLGHEGSGVVLEIGKGVEKVKPGDHVVLSWLKGCGADIPATTYMSNGEEINSGAISSFMQKAVISENRLTAIPKEMPLKLAALLGCAVPTGAGVVFNTAKLEVNQTIAIFGAGGIGMSALLAASSVGAAKIIVVDIVENKLLKAMELGATHVINASLVNPLSEIRRLTNMQGVDVSMECTGKVSVMNDAYEAARGGGGICIIAGNPPRGEMMSVNPFSLIGGKKLVGTWGGESNIDLDIPRYINMFLSGELALQNMGTSEYSLEEVNDALNDLESGSIVRAILRMKKIEG